MRHHEENLGGTGGDDGAALLAGMAPALNPLDPSDSMRDPDGDQLSNLLEFLHGTDPNSADTDRGGAFDGWEAWYDEHRASWPPTSMWIEYARYDSNDDGALDVNVNPDYIYDPIRRWDEEDLPDQDGWSNLREFLEGTDPTNPATDSDGWVDDCDPQPLIPEAVLGPGTDGNYGTNPGPGYPQNSGQGQGAGQGQGISQGSGMGQGRGNGQSQPEPAPGQGQGMHYGDGWGNGQNTGPGAGIRYPARIVVSCAEAGRFLNPDGTSSSGSVSWAKGRPFSLRGIVEVYNEGLASWVPIDQAMSVVIQLNQRSASYVL